MGKHDVIQKNEVHTGNVLHYQRRTELWPQLTYTEVWICGFWVTICKTVHPMPSDHCPVLFVCDVDALWPNGWTDQDETWHAGRPRPGHTVLDGDSAVPTERSTAAPTFEIRAQALPASV